MSLELKWFVYLIIQQGVATVEFALTLLARLGADKVSLEEYAQAVFEMISENLSEKEADALLESVQGLAEYAAAQSLSGDEPPEVYDIEIVDDELPEGIEILEELVDGASPPAADEPFNPFAGRGATPVAAFKADAEPPPREETADDEFDDDDDTVIMEVPDEGFAIDTPVSPAIPAVKRKRPQPAPDTPINERKVGATDNGEGGASVEEVMAKFSRRHAPEASLANMPEAAELEKMLKARKLQRQSTADAVAALRNKTAHTETTRSLKKVKVDAKVLSSGGAVGKAAADTVPLALPRFFDDTARRTLKVDRLPDLSAIENQNSGECAVIMTDLVAALRRAQVSDFYVNAGEPIFARKLGRIHYLDTPVLSGRAAEQLNFALAEESAKTAYREKHRASFAVALRDGRCRCNLRRQVRGISGSYHLAPSYIRALPELGFLPEDVLTIHKMLDSHSGLIVVAGPAGSGKTTTLAAMVDYISRHHTGQTIMLESPIEIIQEGDRGAVIQREIGRHTSGIGAALRAATREDPDVVVLSEIYNPDTIDEALRATEDGLLVIVSMYATSTAAVLYRLMEVFEPVRRPEVRSLISGNLRGVVVQKLAEAAEGEGQTAVYELLVNTPEAAGLLVDGKVPEVVGLMRGGKGRSKGMCTFDDNILAKYRAGAISGNTACRVVRNPDSRMKIEQEVAIVESRKLLNERKQQQ